MIRSHQYSETINLKGEKQKKVRKKKDSSN